MEWWIVGAVVVGIVVLGSLAQRFGLIDLSNKRRSSGSMGGMLSVVDEIFAPTRHEAEIERDRQASLPAPAPLAGDDDRGIYSGQVVIDVTRNAR